MIQYELKIYLRTNSKKHSAKLYFDTKEEAQRFCSANRVKNYTLKQVELKPTSNPDVTITTWSYGDYYYKSF